MNSIPTIFKLLFLSVLLISCSTSESENCPEIQEFGNQLLPGVDIIENLPENIRDLVFFEDNKIAFFTNKELYIRDNEMQLKYDESNSDLVVNEFGNLIIEEITVSKTNELYILNSTHLLKYSSTGLHNVKQVEDWDEGLGDFSKMEFLNETQVCLHSSPSGIKLFDLSLNDFLEIEFQNEPENIWGMEPYDDENILVYNSDGYFLFNGTSFTPSSGKTYIDKDQRTWTFPSDSIMITELDNSVQIFSVEDIGLEDGGRLSVKHKDEKGNIWLFFKNEDFGSFSFGGGIARYDNEEWISYSFEEFGNAPYLFRRILEDSCGNLWILLQSSNGFDLILHPAL
jgi:hypothetical protein